MNKKQKIMLIRIILSSLLAVIVYFLPTDNIIRMLTFVIPFLIAGYDVLKDAILNIIHGQFFDEKFLMTVATIGAFAIKEYPEAVAVMIFYQIGELFQSIAVGKSRKSIKKLMEIAPDSATVIRDGKELEVYPDEVMVGEIILIRAGEKIPLDGIIIEGNTAVNTSALTGESLPIDKTTGDKVISGSINLSGTIKVKTESLFEESTVSKILELVENSADKKAKTENFITKFARFYTPVVVISALLLAIIPPLLFNQNWGVWINRALIFLVVSCPCALVVSVPLSFFGAIGGASKNGILIKGSDYLELLSKIDTVVLDKTGTLTKGSFAVNALHPAGISEDELLDIAAAAESYSTHPVAQSLITAHKGHIDNKRIGEVEELAGLGIKAVVDNTIFYVGNGKLMEKIGADWHDCHLTGTVIHLAKENQYLGHIVINDEIKPSSKEAILKLKSLGVKKTIMLTGDSQKVADEVGKAVGTDEIFAGLLPTEKVEHLEEILSSSHKTAFVGDGINDAPALMCADVGIAMGALGSDAAIESADVVLMDDDIIKLPLAVKISKKAMRIVWQNIIFALAVKFVILILGALGIANIWIAVFGDVGVLVLAILNAMRTLIPYKS